MIITICIVNRTSDQKLLPPAMASFDGPSRNTSPVRNTTTNSEKSEHQRIGEPALAPVGKRKPTADEGALTPGLTLPSSVIGSCPCGHAG